MPGTWSVHCQCAALLELCVLHRRTPTVATEFPPPPFQVYCYFRRLGYIVTRRTFFRDALRYTEAAEASEGENAAKRGESCIEGKRPL